MSELASQSQYYPMDYGWGWGMMAVHGFGWILLLALVIVVAVILFRSFGPAAGLDNGRSAGPRSASEILDARYASGEIDREEYLSKKKDLGE